MGEIVSGTVTVNEHVDCSIVLSIAVHVTVVVDASPN